MSNLLIERVMHYCLQVLSLSKRLRGGQVSMEKFVGKHHEYRVQYPNSGK
jgi:hypothetical protein